MKKILVISILVLLLSACGGAEISALETQLADSNEANAEWADGEEEQEALAVAQKESIDALEAENSTLETVNSALEAENTDLEEENDALSNPPATPAPTKKPKPTKEPTPTEGVIFCADTINAERLSFGYVLGVGAKTDRVALSVHEDCYTAFLTFANGDFVATRITADGSEFVSCSFSQLNEDGFVETITQCSIRYVRDFSAPNLNAVGESGDIDFCFAETPLSYGAGCQ